MRVRMTRTVGEYEIGQEYDVADGLAAAWCAYGACDAVTVDPKPRPAKRRGGRDTAAQRRVKRSGP